MVRICKGVRGLCRQGVIRTRILEEVRPLGSWRLYYGHVPPARDRRTSEGCPGVVLWFHTNVVSQSADRLKIRTNRITSEPAEVMTLLR